MPQRERFEAEPESCLDRERLERALSVSPIKEAQHCLQPRHFCVFCYLIHIIQSTKSNFLVLKFCVIVFYMDIEKEIYQKQGKKVIALGNEAIVRGAIEAGVQFVSTYPGTPASEIGDIFSMLKKQDTKGLANFYFEYSINEKVAMEAAIGASLSGLKTLIAMKNFGLNVASDALLPFIYTGTKGAAVIVVADDPSCHSSGQSEENTRGFANLAHIPILEPSDSEECKDFTKLAFEISDKFKIPIMVRTTTRVNHQSASMKFGKIKKTKNKAQFIKNYHQFVTMPPRILEMHKELLEKLEKIKNYAEKSGINKIYFPKNNAKAGIITSGVSFLHTIEALNYFNTEIPVLKLGIFYPLAEDKIKNFIKKLDKVLIVEELEPYLEEKVKEFAKDVNCKLKIWGKNVLPKIGEIKPEAGFNAIAKFSGKKYEIPKTKTLPMPKRFPGLCVGCPYWAVFNGVKQAIKEAGLTKDDVIFGGGIGCYMLASFAPHQMQDYLFCMGASLGIAHGIKKAINDKNQGKGDQKLIAFVGDSSFFHAEMPALANIVHNGSNPIVIIMDNQTTAMTGHQPYPGIEDSGTKEKGKKIKIEEVIRALGVENLEIIDAPNNYKEFVEAVKNYLQKDELAVIISRHPCIRIKK